MIYFCLIISKSALFGDRGTGDNGHSQTGLNRHIPGIRTPNKYKYD